MNRDQKWSTGTVRTILTNPTYMGARAYNRLKKKGIGKFAPRYWVRDPREWILIQAAHPAIIPADEWKAANPSRQNSERGRRTVIRFDSPYLLSGLLVCSRCRFNFSGKTQTVGVPGKRHKRRTYTDMGYISKGPAVCTSFSIDANKLETELMAEIISRLCASSSILARLEALINKHMKHEQRGVGEHGRTRTLEEAQAYMDRFQKEWSRVPISELKSFIRQIAERIVVDGHLRVVACYILTMPAPVVGAAGH